MSVLIKKQDPNVTIKLGDNILQAKIPRFVDLEDLIERQTKGVIKTTEYAVEILFRSLFPLNPELTIEELRDFLTTDLTNDINQALKTLGFDADNIGESKKKETSQI